MLISRENLISMKKVVLRIFTLFTIHCSLFTIHCLAATGPLLYGMTQGGGTYNFGNIFKIYSNGTGFRSIYSFNTPTGTTPVGSLVQSYSNSKFYGMTKSGGTTGDGVIFSYEPYDSVYTVLVNFNGANGSSPTGNLFEASNGLIYGMTPLGGSNNMGVLFSLDPVTNNFTVLINFNGTNGSQPNGSLIQATNGLLYGMTEQGGAGNLGTVFTFNASNDSLTTIINFTGGALTAFPGANPYGSLVQMGDTNIYGMTSMGGSGNAGVIFGINPVNNAYSVLWKFNTFSSHNPLGSLCLNTNGLLYGMTNGGGALSGSIFQIDPTDSILYTIVTFGSGEKPHGSLILAGNGLFYFMTYGGGTSSDGQVMEFDPGNNTQGNLWSFNGTNGLNPMGDISIQRCSFANFRTDTLNNCQALTTSFLNLSTFSSSYLWAFGDGNTDTSRNPTHTYGFPAFDTVTLYTTNLEGCTDSMKRVYHFVPNPTIASIVADTFSGCPTLTVYFRNHSQNATSYLWYFGDGYSSTSNADSVGHNYIGSGYYDIRLYVHDSVTGCNDTLILHNYLHVLQSAPVTASFTMSDSVGCTPLLINFTNTSSNTTTSYEWYFGDSDSSNTYSPSHSYSNLDTVYPTLVAYNVDTTYPCIGKSTMRDTVILHPSAQAHFSADSLQGCLPLTVHFTNVSYNGISYYWNFGDGDTSTAVSPVYTYTTAGLFTDTLIAYGAAGCNDTSVHVHYIATQVRPNLINSFTGSPLSGCDSLEVQFSNTSSDATFYLWHFGDGNSNSVTNPSHQYTNPGNYSVTLIAYNYALCGLLSDTLVLHNYVNVLTPPNIIITQIGDTLISNFVTGNQWYNYGILISGATSQKYIVPSTGCYQTTYTDSNGCSNISNVICVDFAGISEITMANGITIYPNPAIDQATLVINENFITNNATLSIYNLLGQELQRIALPANQGNKEVTIDRKDIPNGLYFYKIINSNSEVLATGKLIFR